MFITNIGNFCDPYLFETALITWVDILLSFPRDFSLKIK